MKSRVQRWDLVVGAMASLVAVAGLLLSLAVGNRASVGFGELRPELQMLLLSLGAVFLILVAIKAAMRYRRSGQAVCASSIDVLMRNTVRTARKGRACK